MALLPCAECGEKVSTQAKACPKCGGPPPKQSAPTTKFGVGCLTLLLLSCIGTGVLINVMPKNPVPTQIATTTQPAPAKPTWRDKQDIITAYEQMSRHIKARLRSPSTASFPSALTWRKHVRYLGDQRYEINSWVDAQNGFGATVRTHFTGQIMQASERGWIILSLETRP